MIPFFVQIKCKLGQSYDVANKLADAEIASEIYSTAGDFDLLVKFYVDDKIDIGHFVNEKVQVIPRDSGYAHHHYLQGVLIISQRISDDLASEDNGQRGCELSHQVRGGFLAASAGGNDLT